MRTPATVPVHMYADLDRLVSVVQHLLWNPIEVTAVDGRTEVMVERGGDKVYVRVADSECNMQRDFVNKHLFKPFYEAGSGICTSKSRRGTSSTGDEFPVEGGPDADTVSMAELRHQGCASEADPGTALRTSLWPSVSF